MGLLLQNALLIAHYLILAPVLDNFIFGAVADLPMQQSVGMSKNKGISTNEVHSTQTSVASVQMAKGKYSSPDPKVSCIILKSVRAILEHLYEI